MTLATSTTEIRADRDLLLSGSYSRMDTQRTFDSRPMLHPTTIVGEEALA